MSVFFAGLVGAFIGTLIAEALAIGCVRRLHKKERERERNSVWAAVVTEAKAARKEA